MDTRSGEIVEEEWMKALPIADQKHFIPVERDLTLKERSERQILLYEPCGCGSGKKFKFCCYRKSDSNR